ncbi:uncharacterized protein LOC124264427 isoform X1 [Haliotis rubra]|uniref:uncharacterized protein LOC124264427 isoform X1 n=1 Tax=Haliotis rubra TaxID=36100 RepID=UPI001EE4EF75|nr:uncharacterized protein LOC124264427 isoform X1 [Haliotis rubra]XP_046555125.1 uncharacterized protein LOC124264427 isoform X1 [Haliotis rubra]
MMCECRVLCLLMALMVALESSSALISPKDDVNPICLTTTQTLIAHPTKCAQYYNCSSPAAKRTWEKNLQECQPPQLYNPDTQQCEHYSMVTCGNRTEPLGKCDYARYACLGGKDCGPPCYIHTPSCRGRPNGLNAYPNRPGSGSYTVCVNQRLVYTGVCGDSKIFDATLRSCKC